MGLIQIVSVCGALLILGAYGANQTGRLGPQHRSYSLLNLVGSGTLAGIAIMESQWGFLLLEGVWAVVSAWALFRPTAINSTQN